MMKASAPINCTKLPACATSTKPSTPPSKLTRISRFSPTRFDSQPTIPPCTTIMVTPITIHTALTWVVSAFSLSTAYKPIMFCRLASPKLMIRISTSSAPAGPRSTSRYCGSMPAKGVRAFAASDGSGLDSGSRISTSRKARKASPAPTKKGSESESVESSPPNSGPRMTPRPIMAPNWPMLLGLSSGEALSPTKAIAVGVVAEDSTPESERAMNSTVKDFASPNMKKARA